MKFIHLTIHTTDSNDVKEVEKVLRSNRLTQGNKIIEFAKEGLNLLCLSML